MFCCSYFQTVYFVCEKRRMRTYKLMLLCFWFWKGKITLYKLIITITRETLDFSVNKCGEIMWSEQSIPAVY